MEKVTTKTLMEKKMNRKKITWLTGYDFPAGRIEEKASIDIIRVGDLIGMTTQNHPDALWRQRFSSLFRTRTMVQHR
jgi:3-methyl-2-oxobutanoate hydroxymethyltransferase